MQHRPQAPKSSRQRSIHAYQLAAADELRCPLGVPSVPVDCAGISRSGQASANAIWNGALPSANRIIGWELKVIRLVPQADRAGSVSTGPVKSAYMPQIKKG